MNITCYSGFNKKPNSTKQPSGGTDKSVVLKQPTSVLNPVFIIEGYNLSWNYIKWGVRYYYVDDIVIVHNNIAEYHCSTDVMATYKNDIGGSSQYVTRSASASNPKVMDSKYPTIADTDEVITSLSNISQHFKIENGTIVIGLKSKLGTQGVAYYAMNTAQFSSFISYLYSDIWLDATEIGVSLQKMLVDPFDYIVSCNWYPFTITGTETNVYFGFWDWTGQQAQRISEDGRMRSFLHAGTLPSHPQVARGTYLNASPFTRLSLDLYTFGQIVLDPNRFLDSRSFVVNLIIDLYTGVGTVKVQSTTGIVFESSATCSVPIQLSQVRTDLTRPIISTANAVVAYETHNYIGMTASIVDAIKGNLPQISTIGAVGSQSAYYINPPKIDSIFYRIADEDLPQVGRPLCAVRTLSTLPGYNECDNADLDTGASPAEKDAIINYLNSGFYYE